MRWRSDIDALLADLRAAIEVGTPPGQARSKALRALADCAAHLADALRSPGPAGPPPTPDS